MMDFEVLSFWRRSENFALHLIHHILNIRYTLDVNLCIVVYPEVSIQLQPSPSPHPICPHPIPHPSPSHCQGPGTIPITIIPLGVPFKLPCLIFQHPLEQGQIYCYLNPYTTIIRQDQTEPLWVHQESPFVFCHPHPNLNNATHTILLQCSIDPKIHNNSDGEIIPPTSLRTDSPDAYHSTSSTRKPSPSRKRSISPSRDLQQDKF